MNSHNSRLCCGISNSTGNPCRNYAQSADFCRHHKDQIGGKNKYGVLIIQNNSKIKQSQNNYCKGITAVGQPCKIQVKSNNFCRHHKNQNIEDRHSEETKLDNLNVAPCSTQKCNAVTKSGKRCRNLLKQHEKFCHKHIATAEELINALFVPGRAKQNYYSIDGKYRNTKPYYASILN
jgi:hypothetical protein